VSAVAGQFHLVGDLTECGLDAVAPLGDDPQQARCHGRAVSLGGREQDRDSLCGHRCGELAAGEALVGQQPGQLVRALDRAGHQIAFIDRCWHDRPRPDHP
jgi:hypothetical protein